MGIFSKRDELNTVPPVYLNAQPRTLDEATEAMKSTAIEYIVSLNKADKEKFIAGVDLIWQGYQEIDNVKTRHQKALHREAKANGVEDDPDLLNLLDDEGKK